MISLLFLFILVFPKGGIKIGSVPLTWGYLLLILSAIGSVFKPRYCFNRSRLWAALGLLPFQLICIASLLYYGSTEIGFTLSLVLSFFCLPLIFFLFLSEGIDRIDPAFILSWIQRGVLFIACYGIFLFCIKTITGNFFLIPFLTANFHDIDLMEMTKSIDRGALFKLISTYNNGNLYGLCLLMLMPLYNTIETCRMKKTIVKLSLILTLSRTIWIGLIIAELLSQLYVKPISLRFLLRWTAFAALTILAIQALLIPLKVDLSFLFDPSLGGRQGQLEVLSNWHLFATAPFDWISEIVYLSVLEKFGLVGLCSFLVAMVTPLILYRWGGSKPVSLDESRLKKGIVSGLVIYLILCCSDGAILYIPVMAFYWFLSSWLFSDRLRDLVPLSRFHHRFDLS